MTKNVFVYGTLKQGGSNNGLLRSAKFVGAAVTVSGAFTMLNGGFPMVLSGGLFKVRGELFEVSDEMTLKNLDRLEGVPSFFDRHDVSVQLGSGDVVDAFMYVGNPRYGNGANSSRSYVIPDENNVCEWN